MNNPSREALVALEADWRDPVKTTDPHTDAWILGYCRARKECADALAAALSAPGEGVLGEGDSLVSWPDPHSGDRLVGFRIKEGDPRIDDHYGLNWLRSRLSHPASAKGAAVAAPKWGKPLEKPARVGATVFRVGVGERMVVERAQREYEYHINPPPYAKPVLQGDENPAPAVAPVVDEASIDAACMAAYTEMDMGRFPQDAVNPKADRDFVRAALQNFAATVGAKP